MKPILTLTLCCIVLLSNAQVLIPDASFGTNGKIVSQRIFEAPSSNEDMVALPSGKILQCGSGNSSVHWFFVTRHFANGALDSSYGVNGKVTDPFLDFPAYSMALQADGNLVVAGSRDSLLFCTRLLDNGAIDNSFAGGKFMLYSPDTSYRVFKCLVQPDGKVLIAGYAAINQFNQFFICRLNANGTFDNTFGSGGRRVVLSTPVNNATYGNYFRSMALQPDGKIVLTGVSSDSASNTEMVVTRLNVNGSTDNSFGTNGYYVLAEPYYDGGHDIRVQPDGKIVVGGHTNTYGTVVRLMPNGTPDAGFGYGGSGIYKTDSAFTIINRLHIHTDGSISGTGEAVLTGEWNLFALRLNNNGYPNISFGTNGNGRVVMQLTNVNDYWPSSTLLADGKLVIGGALFGSRTTLVKLATDGSTDNSFGTGGIQQVRVLPSDQRVDRVLQQPDGKILALGSYGGQIYTATLLRYKSNGTTDSTFGNNGLFIFQANFTGYALALQPDGKIVVAGQYTDSLTYIHQAALARVTAAGRIDSSFNGTGYTIFPNYDNSYAFGFLNNLTGVAVQADGKIIAAGSAVVNDTSVFNRRGILVRTNSNGTPDLGFSAANGKKLLQKVHHYYDEIADMRMLSSGKLVTLMGGVAADTSSGVAVAQYKADGTPDSTFNLVGYRLIHAFAGSTDYPGRMQVHSDGKIIITGSAETATDAYNTVMRLRADGRMDSSFNQAGIKAFSIPVSHSGNGLPGLAVASGGDIWVAGHFSVNNGVSWTDTGYVVHIRSNGETDSTIASPAAQEYLFTYGASYSFVNDLALKADGSLLVGGSSLSPTTASSFALAAFRRQGVFPVNLLRFDASLSGNDIKTGWETASEQNVSHYTLQLGRPGSSAFTNVYTIAAKNTLHATYDHTLADMPAGVYLLRLEITDRDGKTGYSRVVRVVIGAGGAISLSPNPSAGYVRVRLQQEESIRNIMVFDIAGRQVMQVSGVNDKEYILNTSSWPRGSYIVQLTGSSGKLYEEVLVVGSRQ